MHLVAQRPMKAMPKTTGGRRPVHFILHCYNLNQLVTTLIGLAVNPKLYIISPIVLLIVCVCMYDL